MKEKNKEEKVKDKNNKKSKKTNKYKYYEETIISGKYPIVLSIWEGETSKPVIVFLPGTMAYPQTYNEFLEPLSKLGYNIIGLNFISHGKSPRIKKDFILDDLVENSIDAITYAKAKFGDRIILFGHSQGGIVASKVASIDSRPKAVVSHNVIISTIPGVEGVTKVKIKLTPSRLKIVQNIMKMIAKIMPKKKIRATDYINNVERCIFNEEQVRNIETMVNDENNKDPYSLEEYPLSLVASLFALNTDFLINGEIKTPFYLVAVTGDEVFPYQYMKDCYKAIKAPEKYFVELDCDKHMSLTNYPELTINILTKIFDRY